ncbi:MAG: hypothetical protein N2043_01930 [Ignavibacterium sp.]|nr:hypothetical protein [Ignavibacterium sp.]
MIKGPVLSILEKQKIVAPNSFSVDDWLFNKLYQKFDQIEQVVHQKIVEFRENWIEWIEYVYTKTSELFFQTPTLLIDNPKIRELTSVFLELSVWGVGIAFAIEGIRIIFAGKARNIGELLTKSLIGITGAIVGPHIMVTALWVVNQISTLILQKTNYVATSIDLHALNTTFLESTLEFLGSILFFIAYLYCLARMILILGKRFFDIVVSTSISPLAFSAYIFESTEHYFKKWLSHTTGLYLFQIVYVIYFTVFSVLLSFPLSPSVGGVWIKLLLMIGGLWTMAHPPQWVTRFGGQGINFKKLYHQYKNR